MNIWSVLKLLDYQIFEELINSELKFSFLSLVQLTCKVKKTTISQYTLN